MPSRVIKATFWYTVSNFLLKGLAFITTPIFSRMLTKAEFGSFANYATWCSFLGVVVFSLQASLARGRFEFKDDLNSFIISILTLGSVITIFMSIVLIWNIDFFSLLFVLDKKYIYIMCILVFVNPAYSIFLSMQRYVFKYEIVAVLSISVAVITIVLSFVLISVMEDHLLARVLGVGIPTFIVASTMYMRYMLRGFSNRKQESWEEKGKLLKYWKYILLICVPYIFHVLSHGILGQSDRTMITSICGAEDTALYSMAYNIALAINIFDTAMHNSFAPWQGEKLNLGQYSSIKKYSYPYLSTFATLIVGVMLVAPEALYILGGTRYMEAKYVIPPVVVGCYFGFTYGLYIGIEQFEKKTLGMAIATSAAALINILTNWLFIPIFGYIAAAYTTLFCYFLLWLFHYYLVRRMGLHIIYDTKFIVLVSVAVCAVMVLSLWLYQMTVIRYVVLVCYVGVLVYVGLKNKEKIMVYFGKAGEN